MRALIAVGLLAGCYQPATESCYYACAAQGVPCPSGLECVAGMCATKGTTCNSSGGDGGVDAIIDGPMLACGDGIATIGEVCFGPPIPFTSPGNPMFGQLADREGDGDLDLIFLDNAVYWFHLNAGGVLAPAATQGPSSFDSTTMVTANLNNAPGVELISTSALEIRGHNAIDGSTLFQGFSQFSSIVAMKFGRLTTSSIGALAISHGTQLVIYRFESPTMLSQMGNYPINGGHDIAVGPLNGDVFDDVVVATDSGVVVFLASSLNLGSPSQVGPEIAIARVAIGDFDNDSMNDVAFIIKTGTGGTLGTLLGRGNGTFNPGVMLPIPDLATALAVADIDRDGRSDVIMFQSGASPSVLIGRGKSDGTFELPVKIPVPASASHLSARGDFNGDMVPDIVVTDNTARRVIVIPSKP